MMFLLACLAEDLGVELPPEGLEAISAEDLRRDTEALLQGGTQTWLARMEQMNAAKVPGERVCVRQGSAEATTVWAPLPTTVNEAVDAAALISYAKAWDTLATKPGARVWCLGPGDGTRLTPWEGTATSSKQVDYRKVALRLRQGDWR